MPAEPSPSGPVFARPSRATTLALVGLGVFGVLLVLAMTSPRIEVIESGKLVPDTEHEVDRVEIFGRYRIFSAQETRAEPNVLNSMLLIMITGVTTTAAVLAASRRLFLFFGIAAAGFAALALDQAFQLSETFAYNAEWLDSIPGLRPGTIDVLRLPLAVLFVVVFRDVLFSVAQSNWFWIVGFSLVVAAGLLDVVAQTPIEDAIEVLATACLLLGFVTLAAARLRTEREHRPAVAP